MNLRSYMVVSLVILFGIAAATIEVTSVFKILPQLPFILLIEVSLFVLIWIGVAVRQLVKRGNREQSADAMQQTDNEN